METCVDMKAIDLCMYTICSVEVKIPIHHMNSLCSVVISGWIPNTIQKSLYSFVVLFSTSRSLLSLVFDRADMMPLRYGP